MMFQGAYTNEFYRALHDALHAQVDSWNSRSAKIAQESDAVRDPDELWKRVMRLEQTCRNSRPTVLDSLTSEKLVQLQTASHATSFDEILNVLRS
jgi:hypothetical protein